MSSRPKPPPREVELARRLFLYLRDLAELRTKTYRDLDEYEEVIWFSALPDGFGGNTVLSESDGDEDTVDWLEFGRVALPPFPQPNETLRPWLRGSTLRDSSRDAPELVGSAESEPPIPVEATATYESYVTNEWRRWAIEHRKVKRGFDFYSKLFAMSDRQQRLGEVFELVVGFCFLTWNHGGMRIRRHLITSPAEITIDPDTGAITVSPIHTEGRNRFELDMLEAEDRGNAAINRELADWVENSDSLSLAVDAASIANRWVNQSHPDGRFEPTIHPQNVTDSVTISLSPALILRRRSQRTLSKLLDDIAQRIAVSSEPLPEGVARLVSSGGFETLESGQGRLEDPELYFPLPWNDEQRQIVDRIHSRGLAVQGPPGTGKSHTIANLISHLLAQGKRVLVTSHTDRALRVLHNKIPDSIRPLCISLLGNDRDSIRELESAVQEISAKHSSWSDSLAATEVERLRRQLERLREEKAKAKTELRNIREAQIHPAELGGYVGTTQEIAQKLEGDRSRLNWIPDEVVSPTPPITTSEFADLLDLIWHLPQDADGLLNIDLPEPQQLASADRLEELAGREAAIVNRYREVQNKQAALLDLLTACSADDLARAEQELSQFATTLRDVQAHNSDWVRRAIADVLSHRAAPWQVLHNESTAIAAAAKKLVPEVGDKHLANASDRTAEELTRAVAELLDWYFEGGSLRTGLLAPKVVRRNRFVFADVTLDGGQISTGAQLEELASTLGLERLMERLGRVWQPFVAAPSVGSRSQLIAVFESETVALATALSLADLEANIEMSLTASPLAMPKDWADAEEVSSIVSAIKALRDYRRVEVVRTELEDAKKRLGADDHPVIDRLRSAIEQRDVKSYREATGELRTALIQARDAAKRANLKARLKESAPALTELLPDTEEAYWLQYSGDFENSWRWRYADIQLTRMLEPGVQHRLNQEINRLDDRERTALAELASILAWKQTFQTMKNEQEQALAAWAVVVRKIGRGKGKYVEQHRRDARQYMSQARDAIPVWIMPMYRVAESTSDPMPESFDVIIVDEASQSGVESLFLFYLGKQVIVVGDDQQIAPEAVGINMGAVRQLIQQQLTGLPFPALFNPDTSLFDQAKVRFPGQIVLREHFRCMPEIIQFSNQIAYPQNALIPLRQFGADRLDPIKTVYLPHGYREGQSNAINRPEANEVVARIEKICSDPRYDNLTIGVISLQGEAQARLIEAALLDRLGAQLMLERRIVCGDAYAFQGDERDVMFLSMVAAPNERIGALANDAAKRRFNVAASRARDQVWLIHSVQLADLGAADMRKTLLEYYLDPKTEGLPELSDLDPRIVNEPFDSKFEQDVYISLRDLGFRVIPQVPVAGYRIDLVVEGLQGRLAVECDGDMWHGPEQWEADMTRQRQLERCGWRFVRIRGSEFYRDKTSALVPLLEELERLGIGPHVAGNALVTTQTDPLTGPGEPISVSEVSFGPQPEEPEPRLTSPELIAPVSNVVSARSSPPAEAWHIRDHELNLTVGDHVIQEQLGPATVTYLWPNSSSDEPRVQLLFDTGYQQEYTFDEYSGAGVQLVGKEPLADPAVQTSLTQEPEPSISADRSKGALILAPYPEWTGARAPDPRHADKRQLREIMRAIVAVEGPITADRMYQLIVKAAGFAEVTTNDRHVLNRALFSLVGTAEIRELVSPGTKWPQRVIFARGAPPVVIREKGPRDLFHIPLDEIADLIGVLKTRRSMSSKESIKCDILGVYDLVRLTEQTDRYLDAAWRIWDKRT